MNWIRLLVPELSEMVSNRKVERGSQFWDVSSVPFLDSAFSLFQRSYRQHRQRGASDLVTLPASLLPCIHLGNIREAFWSWKHSSCCLEWIKKEFLKVGSFTVVTRSNRNSIFVFLKTFDFLFLLSWMVMLTWVLWVPRWKDPQVQRVAVAVPVLGLGL